MLKGFKPKKRKNSELENKLLGSRDCGMQSKMICYPRNRESNLGRSKAVSSLDSA